MKKRFSKMFAVALVTVLAVTSAVPAMAMTEARAASGAYEAYAAIVEKYKTAQDHDYYRNDMNALNQSGINMELAVASTDKDLHYTLVDMANDGTPELFIAKYGAKYLNEYGCRGSYLIYDIYGYTNGQAYRLFSTYSMGYRSVYEIMENGIIHCHGSGSARNNSDSYYQVGSNNVGLVRYLEYDGWDGDRYYAATNNPYVKVPVTAAEYYSIQNGYTFKTDLTWYPIGDLSGLRAELQEDAIPVILNGVELACDQPPVIVGGRTLVPLRAIFEGLGASVYWDGATRTVTSTLDGTTVVMTVDSAVMYKNGQAVTLDVPAQIVNDRTMVPVRAVGEAFGADVRWDDATRTVYVTQ